jgi:predicted nucleotidyltransferase
VADRGADAAYAALLERARVDPAVVGVVVFGSRAAGRYATEASDVDAFVVVDGSPEAAAEWQTPHGSLVEVGAMTLDAFRAHALPGDAAAWNRPALIRARVDLDKLDGEIGRIVDRKRRLEPDEARALVDSALDDAINSMYRALRNLEGGRELGGRPRRRRRWLGARRRLAPGRGRLARPPRSGELPRSLPVRAIAHIDFQERGRLARGQPRPDRLAREHLVHDHR